MIATWRIAKRRFADLSGAGARTFGGRWNTPGEAVVYLADHPALAALEVRVHLDLPPDLLPDDYVLMRVDLPDEPPTEIPTIPEDTKAAGDSWIAAGQTAVLRVPSIIVPEASNFLLNPAHPAAALSRIVSVVQFSFDRRLWRTV